MDKIKHIQDFLYENSKYNNNNFFLYLIYIIIVLIVIYIIYKLFKNYEKENNIKK